MQSHKILQQQVNIKMYLHTQILIKTNGILVPVNYDLESIRNTCCTLCQLNEDLLSLRELNRFV